MNKKETTVRDIARASGKSMCRVIQAKNDVEIFGNYSFEKIGRKYIFDEHETKMIMDVLKNGIAAAKQTRYYKGTPKKEVYL